MTSGYLTRGITVSLGWEMGCPVPGGGLVSTPAPVNSVISNLASLTFTRIVANTDVTIIVQGADSLSGPWTDLAQSVNGNAMTSLVAGATVTESGTGATRSVEVRDTFTVEQASHPRRFLRVKSGH